MRNFYLALICLIYSSYYAQPINDDCANATNIIPSIAPNCDFVFGTLSGATNSVVGISSCNVNAGVDIWYKFVANNATQFIAVYGNTADIGFELRSSCSPSTTFHCKNETVSGFEISNYINFTPGNLYYLRIFNVNQSSPASAVQLCIIDYLPPANDKCINAISLTPNETCNLQFGNFAGSTNDGLIPTSTCVQNNTMTEGQDIWYKFIPNYSVNKIKVEDQTSNVELTLNSAIEIRKGSCNATTLDACSNNSPSGLSEELIYNNFVPGQLYYIRLINDNNLNLADLFKICIQEYPTNLCQGFPSSIASADSSGFTQVMLTNENLNTGLTRGVNSVTGIKNITGLNLNGGSLYINGNVNISGNFNSGNIIVNCGSNVTFPNGLLLNNRVKIVNYGNITVRGDFSFQNTDNVFYNESINSRLIVTNNLIFAQNNGQNGYLKNNGFIRVDGSFRALDGGYTCLGSASVLQCKDLTYIQNCGGPANRFTFAGGVSPALIHVNTTAVARATFTSSNMIKVNFSGGTGNSLNCGATWGNAVVSSNKSIPVEPNSASIFDCSTSKSILDLTQLSNSKSNDKNLIPIINKNSDFSLKYPSETDLYKSLKNISQTEFLDVINQNTDSLHTYPIPFQDILNLRDKNTIESVEILDQKGKVTIKEDNLRKTNIEIKTENVIPGIYFMIIRYSNGTVRYNKVIKL